MKPDSELYQLVRVFDVLVLGPTMIYAARHIEHPVPQQLLFLSGIATIIFNGLTFLTIERDE